MFMMLKMFMWLAVLPNIGDMSTTFARAELIKLPTCVHMHRCFEIPKVSAITQIGITVRRSKPVTRGRIHSRKFRYRQEIQTQRFSGRYLHANRIFKREPNWKEKLRRITRKFCGVSTIQLPIMLAFHGS